MTDKRLGLKEVSLFFLPLLLNVQLMSVSHSVINAALARLEDFVTALAAFSVAMVVHLFFASPSYQNHTITIAMVRGRKSFKGTVLFVLLVATYVSVMLGLIAYTSVGDFVLGTVLGVKGRIASEAREVIGILALLPFFTGFRGLFQGLVIRARRTGLVSFATGLRIAALLGFLALGTRWYSGPALGAFGLLCCIAVETIVMGFFALRYRLPAEVNVENEKGAAEIIRYAFPLAYSSCLQQTIPLLINAIVSRLPDAPLALASLGVIRGFLFLLSGPMRNLQQAYLTLVKNDEDYGTLVRFAHIVAAVMGATTLLVAYPLNGLVLGRIMGIEQTMRAYIALPLAACTIFPLLYGASNLLRGWFAGAHMTSRLGRSVIYKVTFILLCWALMLIAPPNAPGVAIGIFLLITAELVEAAYLRLQRNKLIGSQSSLSLGGRSN